MSIYYEDGLVTLYHGDCLDVLATLDMQVDSLITDPPYGLNIGYGRTALGVRRIEGDEDTVLIDGVFGNVAHSMKPDAWAVTFCGYPQVGGVQRTAVDAGYTIKTVIVWDKKMPSLGMGIRNQHELIVLAKKGRPVESFTGGNVWSFTRTTGTPQHPHMKPQTLMTRLVDYYSPERGGILDPFAGSGSTLVAAKNMGRRSVGVELDERYCEIAAKRLSQDVLNFGEPA